MPPKIFLLIPLFITSCAKVQLVDFEVCADAGVVGAFCNTTLSSKEREIPKEAWDKERFGMLCMKAEAFAEIKAAILKLCHDNKRCVLEVEEKANEIDSNIKKAQVKTKKVK